MLRMKRYNHLSYDERVKISQLKQSGLLAGQIASAIGRPVCTVYRELKRNEAPPGQYWPDTAHRLSSATRQGYQAPGNCYGTHAEPFLDT